MKNVLCVGVTGIMFALRVMALLCTTHTCINIHAFKRQFTNKELGDSSSYKD